MTIDIRPAAMNDADPVADLASQLSQSFPFDRTAFGIAYPQLILSPDAALLLAMEGDRAIGYVLGFAHLTFFANGPVASVEEILVHADHRGSSIGRALMTAFERWAADAGCVLVSLATRRAAPFYRALGYAESAAYLRKDL